MYKQINLKDINIYNNNIMSEVKQIDPLSSSNETTATSLSSSSSSSSKTPLSIKTQSVQKEKIQSPISPSLQIKKTKSLEFSKKSVPLEYSATISIKNNFVLPIPFTADSELTYTFSTKPGDISFGMIYKTSAGDEIVLRKQERLESHIAAAVGTIHCPEIDGILFLEWDNTFSWFTAKELTYKVELRRSCTLEGMTEMTNKINKLQLDLSESNNILSTVNAENSTLKVDVTDLNEKILEYHKQLKVLNENLSKEEEKNNTLQIKLVETSQSLDDTQKSLDDSQKLLQLASRRMEEEIKKVVTEEMTKRIKLEDENKRLCSDILASKKFFNEMEEFHKQREKSLEESLNHAKEQLVDVQKLIESDVTSKKYRELLKTNHDELVTTMKNLFQAEKEVLVGKVEGLQLEIEVFMEEIEVLKAEKQKYNDDINEKTELIEKLTAECNKWVTSLKDLRTIFSSEKESLEAEVKTLRGENTKLVSDISLLEEANEKLRSDQENWINLRESSLVTQSDKDLEFDSIKNQYHNAMENFKVLQLQHESTAKEYDDLKLTYQKANAEIKELNTLLLQAKANSEEYARKLEKHVESSVAKAKQTKADYDDLSNKYVAALEEHNAFAKSVEMANQQIKSENQTPSKALDAEKLKNQDLETKFKGLQAEFTIMFKNLEDLKLAHAADKLTIGEKEEELSKLQRINSLYLQKLKHASNDNHTDEVEVKNEVEHSNVVEIHNEKSPVEQQIKSNQNNDEILHSRDDCGSEISFASVTSSVAIHKLTPNKNSTSSPAAAGDWTLAGFFTRL